MPAHLKFLLFTALTFALAAFISLRPACAHRLSDEQRLKKGQTIVSVEDEKSSGEHLVRAKTLVHAPANLVWESVHNEHRSNPDIAYSKVLKKDKNGSLIEQKLVSLPFIGSAVCVLSTHETPGKRIDYKLVRSDRFKALDGSWIVSPSDSSNATIVELTSHMDAGLPFPRSFLDGITGKKLARRVNNVRKSAEDKAILAQGQGQPDQ